MAELRIVSGTTWKKQATLYIHRGASGREGGAVIHRRLHNISLLSDFDYQLHVSILPS